MTPRDRLFAALLYAGAWLVGRLPFWLLYRLADFGAWLSRLTHSREYRVTLVNLHLVMPELDAGTRADLARAVLRATLRGGLETLRFWARPPAANLRQIRAVQGREHLDAALAGGRGVIVLAPHYGNWELLSHWLATVAPIAVLYRPPEHAWGEVFLQRVRRQPDIRPVRAEGTALRQLLRALADGHQVGILPDQQPKAGEGVFAPFYGQPALTMTLVARLLARTGAAAVFAWAERVDDRARFDIHVAPAPAGLDDADPVLAATVLNAGVESVARRDPAQYQWTYKRYTLRPPGSELDNPYWPGCASPAHLRRAARKRKQSPS